MEFKGVKIWEKFLPCKDCDEENGTHNTFHHPHAEMVYSFNTSPPDEAERCQLIEEYLEDEIKISAKSWTQFAIEKCNLFAT